LVDKDDNEYQWQVLEARAPLPSFLSPPLPTTTHTASVASNSGSSSSSSSAVTVSGSSGSASSSSRKRDRNASTAASTWVNLSELLAAHVLAAEDAYREAARVGASTGAAGFSAGSSNAATASAGATGADDASVTGGTGGTSTGGAGADSSDADGTSTAAPGVNVGTKRKHEEGSRGAEKASAYREGRWWRNCRLSHKILRDCFTGKRYFKDSSSGSNLTLVCMISSR